MLAAAKYNTVVLGILDNINTIINLFNDINSSFSFIIFCGILLVSTILIWLSDKNSNKSNKDNKGKKGKAIDSDIANTGPADSSSNEIEETFSSSQDSDQTIYKGIDDRTNTSEFS